MKTLKELYEIVKAAGGDFPFAVEWCHDKKELFNDGAKLLAFAMVPSGGVAVEDLDSFEISSWGNKLKAWQFPKDSPYLEPTKEENADCCIQLSGEMPEWMKSDKIEFNRQRWEDLGKPWGRLKEGAGFLFEGRSCLFQNAHGDQVVFARFHRPGMVGFGADECKLSDKTLLHLDDWLLPEIIKSTATTTHLKETCNFCKGKEELTWATGWMPCPYCNPGEFE